MSQLELGAYRIRRGAWAACLPIRGKLAEPFCEQAAALLRKILTLRPPRKRSTVKFRRRNLDYAGKIALNLKDRKRRAL